jgi:hypothetical protein
MQSMGSRDEVLFHIVLTLPLFIHNLGFELLILLPWPPQQLGYQCIPSHLVQKLVLLLLLFVVLGFELRASHLLDHGTTLLCF